MTWQTFDNNKAIYMQIMDQLILKIVSGTYPPGSKLPTVRELAVDMSVNPNTMQRAFMELEEKGIVITKRTTGRFVCEDLSIIKKLRKQLAGASFKQFVHQMNRLGYSNKDILAMVKDLEEEQS